MADYLSTNTPRLKMTQTGPRGTHKMTFRVKPATTQAAAVSAVSPIIEYMLMYMCAGSAWAAAEWAPEGSDVFLPVTWVPINSVPGDRIPNNNTPYGAYINFVGRSSAGSRAAFYLFNVHQQFLTANNRLINEEDGILNGLIGIFAANDAVLCAIDQNSFVLKLYANTGINDKVAKKSRALV